MRKQPFTAGVILNALITNVGEVRYEAPLGNVDQFRGLERIVHIRDGLCLLPSGTFDHRFVTCLTKSRRWRVKCLFLKPWPRPGIACLAAPPRRAVMYVQLICAGSSRVKLRLSTSSICRSRYRSAAGKRLPAHNVELEN